MPATKTRYEDKYDKAVRLASDPSNITTRLSYKDVLWVGVITGDHGRYPAFAMSEEMRLRGGE
jgi:hypothetical protein